MDVLGIHVGRLALQYQMRHVLERACALHCRNTGRDLIEMIRLAEFVRRQSPHTMFPLSTQFRRAPCPVAYTQRSGTTQHAIAAIEAVAKSSRGQTRRGAHSEVSRLVDRLTDLDEVIEDGGINGVWTRGEIIAMGERLEDFWRELQPGSMERRNVAPMPIEDLLGHVLLGKDSKTADTRPRLTCCDR